MLRRVFFFRWIRTVFAILTMSSLCCGKTLLRVLLHFVKNLPHTEFVTFRCEEMYGIFKSCYSDLAFFSESFINVVATVIYLFYKAFGRPFFSSGQWERVIGSQ